MFNSSRSVFRYLALSLALGAACLSAPALAKDNDDLLGDFLHMFNNGSSSRSSESKKPKQKTYINGINAPGARSFFVVSDISALTDDDIYQLKAFKIPEDFYNERAPRLKAAFPLVGKWFCATNDIIDKIILLHQYLSEYKAVSGKKPPYNICGYVAKQSLGAGLFGPSKEHVAIGPTYTQADNYTYDGFIQCSEFVGPEDLLSTLDNNTEWCKGAIKFYKYKASLDCNAYTCLNDLICDGNRLYSELEPEQLSEKVTFADNYVYKYSDDSYYRWPIDSVDLISLDSDNMHFCSPQQFSEISSECGRYRPMVYKAYAVSKDYLYIPKEVYSADSSVYDSLQPYSAYSKAAEAAKTGDNRAYTMLKSAARRKCNHACIMLANCLLPKNHPLKPDDSMTFIVDGADAASLFKEYLNLYTAAAENGSATAAKTLANLYREGKYVGKDANQIFKYTKIAALAKEPEYMYRLGTYYAQGLGCQKDHAAAVKWVKQAAHLGSSEASEWIEDRRGHYVDAEVAAGSERVNIYTVFDNVDKRFYERYNRMKNLGYPDRVAATEALIYSGRVTVGAANFCISRGAAIPASVCGIVGNTFTDKGIDYAVLAYDGETLLLRDFAKLYLYKGKAVCVSCGLKNPIANSIVDSYDSARTIYKTVREWHGPKVKGWEDLL